jgi:hypothetical protein
MQVSTTLEIVVGVASAAMFVGSILAIPWLVRRLPQDYFVRPQRRRSLGVTILRNVFAVVLIALGIAMLVLPGQGIITVLVGLTFLDLPIKKRALRWLLQRKKIQEGVQRLRAKKGKPPLVIPEPA